MPQNVWLRQLGPEVHSPGGIVDKILGVPVIEGQKLE
jgi:hypothetical protein